MEQFLVYYGIDWIAIALSLLAVYMLGNKNKYGFLVFAFSNVMWVFLGFSWMESIGMAIGNIVFFVVNVRGYFSWVKESKLLEVQKSSI